MKGFIGFENIINGFMKREDKNTLSHAHIITGPDGIGKSIIAKMFARKILGKTEDINYADIIHYSEDIDGDMSLMTIKDFLFEIGKVADECYRVLKKDKFCAILMGDTRKKGMVQPLAFETMRIFEMAGFKTKEIIIKEQHNCKATGYWKTNSIKFNFLLLAHEYLFVFKK